MDFLVGFEVKALKTVIPNLWCMKKEGARKITLLFYITGV